MKCPHCGKFIAAKSAPKQGAAKPQKQLYYDGILTDGMGQWDVKTLYKIGKAGRAGRGGVVLPRGKVFDRLTRTGCLMLCSGKGKKPEKWMLTAVGQYYYGNIKFR